LRSPSALGSRHRALGARLDRSWNGRPVAERYATDPDDEVAAVRGRAGLIDISSHNIVTVEGARAAECLDALLTSNIGRLRAGDTHCSNIVNGNGGLIDDVLVYCDDTGKFRLSHGEGKLFESLSELAPNYGVSVARDDDVHVLSLQGPRSPAVLQSLTPLDLAGVGYGVHRATNLAGLPVSIVRGGFFGETGFEIFCSCDDAVALWDAILTAGRDCGVVPVSWRCLEIARVEAGLLFFPYDMPYDDTTPFEVGAGWTVDFDKGDFRGKAALLERQGKERFTIAGIEADADFAMPVGARIIHQVREIGRVTSAVFSRYLMKSLAMSAIVPAHAIPGTAVTVQADEGAPVKAMIVRLPFYDPLRLRTRV